MTASAVELKQLKRALLSQYEDEITAQTTSAAANEDTADQRSTVLQPNPFPSAPSLQLQLLCLRSGKSVKDVPTTAREEIVLMASGMPSPNDLVEDRLRRAQDESVRLLVKRTTAVMAPAGDAKASPAPANSADRLELLERLYASNTQALAGGEESKPPAAPSA
ncbi:putative Kinetoplast-associated protein-like proteinglycoprotein 96-92 [Leptomonas pyrrhocoris]|uniref:Putative Kinetoplast-associated protein-like proteinglycoprotein 96-92 n=1 Tax=Leptomonas pyrrhocoris TaxID=157538 RepID=A0A0M9G7D9_LEPPY|nr:putative Kinetoplast-associated protein-like proteinglycoprotein 96-92 [Leptomonas pyrrhocoris]XP_015662507.1 putative Kinetoplast-associated protein-like proteinglycoprotein 96-92 [Leptomonas pyrrhocoris]KPA84067.1 putative Kinetoplast-associated protein-like proteinglycoprotein 96-92 [Leptomonas pyrrhocoris]KPA84068.1 putative Kinetoplast-associated protein-like proteinglycoprotein 96-92 [Leptomonas pyrrhocoris]|eukprot:XP_015662506.1 putative Kinetoplast-associated protein-like proteinglycoprotein 96-92 [Leptomonas pyrrhocoris]